MLSTPERFPKPLQLELLHQLFPGYGRASPPSHVCRTRSLPIFKPSLECHSAPLPVLIR